MSTPRCIRSQEVGWVSFAVVFNSLNTIVYGLLFPLLLKRYDPTGYSQKFSIATTITTVVSAVLLPVWGAFDDLFGTSGKSQRISSFFGVLLSGLLVPLFASTWADWSVYVAYVIAMLMLRAATMCNNSILGDFATERKDFLSLLGNLVGFVVNMAGLYALFIAEDTLSKGMWVLLCTAISAAAYLVTLVCKDPGRPDAKHHPSPSLTLLKDRFAASWTTITSKELRPAVLFLGAYQFFAVGGTTFTVYLSVFFLDNVNCPAAVDDDQCTTEINLYFKIAMVAGVFTGLLFDKLVRKDGSQLDTTTTTTITTTTTGHAEAGGGEEGDSSINDERPWTGPEHEERLLTSHPRDLAELHIDHLDVTLLWAHLLWYILSLLALFVAGQANWGFYTYVAGSVSVALCYGWNVSLSRTIMSKLSPSNNQSEVMGLYSSITYVGIAACSGIVSILESIGMKSSVLPIVLVVYMLPATYFLFKLQNYPRRMH